MVSAVVTAVLLPFGVRAAGKKLQVENAGRPEQANVVCWLNPPTGESVMVALPDPPSATVMVAGVAASEKAGAMTISVTLAEVEPALFASPPYCAVMVCVPAVRADVVSVATPEELRVPVPSAVAPSSKVTVPVGIGAPAAGVMVAVNVRLAPRLALALDAARAVLVVNLLTVTTTAVERDVAKLVSPLYCAVMVSLPTGSAEVVSAARPDAVTALEPSVVAPIMNVMEPVGTAVPEAGVTAAVSVTLVPGVICVADEVSDVLVVTPGKSVVASAAVLAASTLPALSVAML